MKTKLTKLVAGATLLGALTIPLLQAAPAQARDHDRDGRHDNGLHRGWYKHDRDDDFGIRGRSGNRWRNRSTTRDWNGGFGDSWNRYNGNNWNRNRSGNWDRSRSGLRNRAQDQRRWPQHTRDWDHDGD